MRVNLKLLTGPKAQGYRVARRYQNLNQSTVMVTMVKLMVTVMVTMVTVVTTATVVLTLQSVAREW